MKPALMSLTEFRYRKNVKFSTQVELSVLLRQKVSSANQPSSAQIPWGWIVLFSMKMVLLNAVLVELTKVVEDVWFKPSWLLSQYQQ